RVVLDGDGVWDGFAVAVFVASEEEDAVVAGAAVEAVGEGGDDRAVAAGNGGKGVGDDLEGIVAALAEEEVAGLTIEAAGEDVVALAAQNPVFAAAARKDVVARTAEDDVAAEDRRLPRQIRRDRRGGGRERELIDGGN